MITENDSLPKITHNIVWFVEKTVKQVMGGLQRMWSETDGGRWMEVVVHETSMTAPSKSIQQGSSEFESSFDYHRSPDNQGLE